MPVPYQTKIGAVPGSQRELRFAGVQMASTEKYFAAMTDYQVKALSSPVDALAAMGPPPSFARPLFADSAGHTFAILDSPGGLVSVPSKSRPAKLDEPTLDSGFIPLGAIGEVAKVREPDGHLAGLVNLKKLAVTAGYPSASVPEMAKLVAASQMASGISGRTLAEILGVDPTALQVARASSGDVKPGLMDGAVSSLAQGLAMSMAQGMAQGLAAGQSLLSCVSGTGSGLGEMLGAGGLTSMASSQLLGMAFGQLGQALFGGVGDDSSLGSQLGAKYGKEAMGKLQASVQAELEKQVKDLLGIKGDQAADKAASESDSMGESIKKFLSGVSSSASVAVTRMGDKTTDQGTHAVGAATVLVNGKPVVRALDQQICPIPAHVGGPVREGNPTFIAAAMPVSGVGHMVICTGVGLQNPILKGSPDVFMSADKVALLPPPERKSPSRESSANDGTSAARDPSSSGGDQPKDGSERGRGKRSAKGWGGRNLTDTEAKEFSDKAYGRAGLKTGDIVSLNGEDWRAQVFDGEEGFRAVLFKNADGRAVLAFAGTDTTGMTDFLRDAWTDAQQAAPWLFNPLTQASQYTQALDLARLVQSHFTSDELLVAGHSLGGGMANYISCMLGIPGVGINSAPLGLYSQSTILAQGANPDGAGFTHYRNPEDWVSNSASPGVNVGEVCSYTGASPVSGGVGGHTLDTVYPGRPTTCEHNDLFG